MAITPILEKLLLQGKAKNKIHHFAFSSFTRLEIPENSFIVIHKIYWNPFINPEAFDITQMTWKEFFQYSEYQLKIQSAKNTPIYYILRNEISFDYFKPNVFPPGLPELNLDELVNIDTLNKFMLLRAKKPVIFDTWISSYDYLNFTLTRNSQVNVGVTVGVGFAPVNNYAEELTPPNGIAGTNVLLEGIFLDVSTTDYQPPTNRLTSLPLPSNEVESYHQQIVGNTFGDFHNHSMIADPNTAPLIQGKNNAYVFNPLISFEYCVIQKNAIDHSPL
jgi:hypothetical protein